MNKRNLWRDDRGDPTWFCMIVSAIVGIGGFYAFFILMALLETFVNA